MGITAAVAGASGYAGGELIRLLLAHPEIQLGPLAAGSAAGQRVTAVHPHLGPLADRAFKATEPAVLAEADVVFLALPHGESAPITDALPATMPVIDLGADHRLTSAEAWQQFYGGEPAPAWPYGLPEMPGMRPVLAAARRIAAPGCYPTAVAVALAPLLSAGLVEPADVVVVAASGTSGAGRAAKPSLLGSEVMGDVSAYKAGGTHQHTPEMEQTLSVAAGQPVTLSFTPMLAPMPRGILATVTARLRSGVDTATLRAAMEASYAGEPFVRLLPAGSWPRTAATSGCNAAHVQVAADPHAGRAVAVAAIDNLGKGAAGQAIQCANLMLGLPETAGLSAVGIAP
ncbi:MAG: N-acetyl-gamma-glutamyl-phosphate reductase [Frankiaceae bacterium]